MCQPICIGSQLSQTRKLITADRHVQDIHQVFSNTQSDKITPKGNSIHYKRERGKNIIRSNYSSKAHGTSRSRHLKNTRERDQTHSYWYIPSAPRENYSLLVMEIAGMMKMATGDGFPLRQGAGTGSRLVFGGYRGLRRRNSRSRFLLGGF